MGKFNLKFWIFYSILIFITMSFYTSCKNKNSKNEISKELCSEYNSGIFPKVTPR